jgi:hypothetical protein
VFSSADPYTGVDLDDCVDENGEIALWALEIVHYFDSYTELSATGTGLHVIVRGDVPNRRKGDVDEAQLDSLNRRSGLCREKWLKRPGYRRSTIEKALSKPTETYSPSDDGARMIVGNGHASLRDKATRARAPSVLCSKPILPAA